MNPRERKMAVLLLILVLGCGGGLLIYAFLISPMRERVATLDRLKQDAERKEDRKAQILADRPKLQRWKQLSLPNDSDLARREYEEYLDSLLRASGISSQAGSVTAKPVDAKNAPTLPGKGVIYTRLSYGIVARTDLKGLVRFLEGFYRANLLHQIRSLSITKPNNPGSGTQRPAGELDVTMTVEALIVNGSGNRALLWTTNDRWMPMLESLCGLQIGGQGLAMAAWVAGPSGPYGPGVLAQPSRDYAALAGKDIFIGTQAVAEQLGQPDWIAPRFTRIVDITRNDQKLESSLFDVYNNRRFRLRDSSGFNTFPLIKDGQGRPVVNGQVVRIDAENRDLFVHIILAASDPPSASRGDRDRLYRLNEQDRERLVRECGLKTDDGEMIFRLDSSYWDKLVRQKVVQPNQRGDKFQIELAADTGGPLAEESPRVELLGGRVLRREGQDVFLLITEKYGAMHWGLTLEDALKKPLTESQVKELKSTRAQAKKD
jgi:hypothetical protein